MKTHYLAAFVFTLLLAACGGGGGSSSSGIGGNTGISGSGTGTGSTTVWENAVTSVPAATYTGDNLTVYTQINAARSASGAGLYAQNAALDKAAAAHAQYLLDNWSVTTLQNFHSETSGLTGFTGTTPAARDQVAGYTGNGISEIGVGILASGTATDCVNSWLDSVYHAQDLFGQGTDVGIAAMSDASGNYVCVVESGTSLATGVFTGQLPATTLVYPYSGATNVQTTFVPAAEEPNPAPDVGTGLMGQPILVSGTDAVLAKALPNGWTASQVTINGFTVTVQGSSTPVAVRLVVTAGTVGAAGVTVTNDVGGLFTGLAYALPLAPLSANTTYNVSFTANVNGQVVTYNGSFTTGAGN